LPGAAAAAAAAAACCVLVGQMSKTNPNRDIWPLKWDLTGVDPQPYKFH
jgi:hypothetical protein